MDLTNASPDTLLACATTTGNPDVFYRLTLGAPADLTVTSAGKRPGTVDTALGLRAQPCASGATLACADLSGTGVETLRARALPAGTYTLVVQATAATASQVVLRGYADPPAPAPANDTCAAPRAITFAPGSATTTVTADTFFANDDYAGSCNPVPNSPELVYALNLTAPRTVTITAAGTPFPNGNPSASAAAIYLRSGSCDGGTELGCDVETSFAATITTALQPGTYYLFVEGQGLRGAGQVTVDVTLSP